MSHRLPNPKLFSEKQALKKRSQLRTQGKKLVFTNGCFDLLHKGHLYYLQQAKTLGDQLWVALNADQSIRELKGPSRPVQPAKDRAYALSALQAVDGVIVFQEARLTHEILVLKPDIYVKAADYTLETLDPQERSALQKVGADIQFLPFLEGYSTTDLIEKIARAADTF